MLLYPRCHDGPDALLLFVTHDTLHGCVSCVTSDGTGARSSAKLLMTMQITFYINFDFYTKSICQFIWNICRIMFLVHIFCALSGCFIRRGAVQRLERHQVFSRLLIICNGAMIKSVSPQYLWWHIRCSDLRLVSCNIIRITIVLITCTVLLVSGVVPSRVIIISNVWDWQFLGDKS